MTLATARAGAMLAIALSVGCSSPSSDAPDEPGAGGAGGRDAGIGFETGISQSCADGRADAPPDAGASTCDASRAVSFAKDVTPILGMCAGELCHSSSFAVDAGYVDLVGQPSTECCDGRLLVAPGHPEVSYLLDKLGHTNLCAGAGMPEDQAKLAPAALQTIYDWICEGAPAN